MMTVTGDILARAVFVELISSTDSMVTIRKAEDKWQHLTCDGSGNCMFTRPVEAIKFKPMMSPAGKLVFEL
ncbi:hypothetical protein PC116_g26523 [Phytophthora cactorum]|uniref:Uncharacterized protein n=1 Tax=Phytophthora cactorum TaxID=29920 RepID=A0A8T1AVR9_9STRA|nr:hypothetical protein PC111_g21940 [Phytophthora cactorum]KAG2888941.1 hypothetical protein PC114_g18181 [Phytophthora cactorum]KAG2889973.1 hypothetical protein PC117_g24580 [Phytophthora cactorum]KAG4047812.1 hypothetical protein PC123_g16856 [Phytophthora cactorum]KAG4225033.1 hypothetical protein PC116_g26523 [Phytophthora cactorum]